VSDHLSQKRFLLWSPGGMPVMLDFEGAVVNALRNRGAEAHAVICDGVFRACIKREVQQNVPIGAWSEVCGSCKAKTSATLDRIGIPYSYIGNYISQSIRDLLWIQAQNVTWENLENLNYDSINVGKNAKSSIIRFLQGEAFDGDKKIVHEYAYSALVTAHASKNAFDKLTPNKIFMSHGVYVDWGPALQWAIQLNIPLTAWMASYLSCHFYFRHVEDNVRIDFHKLSERAWARTESHSLSDENQKALSEYLKSRYVKKTSFDLPKISAYRGSKDSYRKMYGLTKDLPIWGIMCHINWDAVSDYSPMAYDSFDNWLIDTINEISLNSHVQWVIKIHPAEAVYNPENGLHAVILKKFPILPEHVKIIPASVDVLNPLDFFELIDGAITVYGTSGLELLLHGKPVILAGEAHYGGKGFTYDGLTIETYRQHLKNVQNIPPLTSNQKLSAKKYAYGYFIQRQIPFPAIKDQESNWWSYQDRKEKYLKPGNNVFTDFICDRMLDGEDFIMSDELVKQTKKALNPTIEDKLHWQIRKSKTFIRKILPKKLVCMIKQKI